MFATNSEFFFHRKFETRLDEIFNLHSRSGNAIPLIFLCRTIFSMHKINKEVLPSGSAYNLCKFGEEVFIHSVSYSRVGSYMKEPLTCFAGGI